MEITMRRILPAAVAGLLTLGLAASSRAQMPVGRDLSRGYYGQDRDKYPVVYQPSPYGPPPFGPTSNMYSTVVFGGCHGGCYPTWAIPWSCMTSKFYGSQRYPWYWTGE
jgi:hypothetical protein